MFTNPIVIYSKYCKYSNEFLDVLVKTPLAQQFQFVDIDINPQTKTRSEIYFTIKHILAKEFSYNLKTVPTIIVENGEFVLSGKEAFEWLKYKLNTIQNASVSNSKIDVDVPIKNEKDNSIGEPSGFIQHEMGSFSDSYSTFGLNIDDTCTDAKNQCFQFLDDSFMSSGHDAKAVRFNDETKSAQKTKFKTSAKENELNSRYEELIMKRKELDKTLKPVDRI